MKLKKAFVVLLTSIKILLLVIGIISIIAIAFGYRPQLKDNTVIDWIAFGGITNSATVVLTSANLIATVMIISANQSIVKISKEQLNLLTVPQITIGFCTKNNFLNLVVRNDGNSTAEDVTISIDIWDKFFTKAKEENIKELQIIEEAKKAFESKISIMPKQQFEYNICHVNGEAIEILKEYKKITINVTFLFCSKKENKSVNYNIGLFSNPWVLEGKTEAESIEKLCKTISENSMSNSLYSKK